MKSVLLSLAMIVLGVPVALARDWTEGLAFSKAVGNHTMPYRLYLPKDYDPADEYPLVLFLHGAGERGTNNRSQVQVHISGLIDKTYEEFPAILLAPQVPPSSFWYPGLESDLTPEILQDVISNYSVDADRLHMTGLSMGGFGTLDYLDWYYRVETDRFQFASVVPMSGGFSFTVDPAAVDHFRHVPNWLIHGANDAVVPAELSRATFASLVNLNSTTDIVFNERVRRHPTATVGDIRYTEVLQGGHVIWSPFYFTNEVYEWMFSYRIPEPGAAALVLAAIIAAGPACSRRSRRRI